LKKSLFFVLILTFTFVFAPVSFSQEAESPSGDITFQPNSIPSTTIAFDNSRFVFDYEEYHLEVAMSLSVDNFEYEIEFEGDKIKTKVKIDEIEHEFEAEADVVVEKFESNITWGFNVFDINSTLANHTDFLVFRLVNLSFSQSEFELETVEEYRNETSFELYNVTRILIPKANLVFSFEDLYPICIRMVTQ